MGLCSSLMRETLTMYKQLLQNFLKGCRLCFKWSIVEREAKGHTPCLCPEGPSGKGCAPPLSCFGCWNQRDVPYNFKIQWITVPCEFWVTKKTTSVWRSYLQAHSEQEVQRVPVPSHESHGSASTIREEAPAYGCWQPWQKQLVELSCLYLPSPGCRRRSVAPFQTGKSFSFGFGYKQGFIISVIQYQKLHYSQWRATK